MRILVLVSAHQHAHDYGIDYLLDGLREHCGADNVLDWPEKPCLHLAPGAPRDACTIDSDAWWPSKGDVDIAEWAQRADLVILGQSLEDPPGNAEANRVLRDFVPLTTPVLALDMSDHVRDRRYEYAAVACRPFLYAKRELPLGADWAIPCPMTYPASRVPNPMPVKFPRLVYHATHHGEQPPGVPRKLMVGQILGRPDIPKTHIDVALYPSQENRPTPEEYHDKMARGLIGLAYNGAPNWDNNRVWESFAHALCLVSERPRIEIPNPPQHLRHAYWVDSPEEVAPAVAMLLKAPGWAAAIADAGHKHFLAHHCSQARAAYLLDEVRCRA